LQWNRKLLVALLVVAALLAVALVTGYLDNIEW
jgi:hypothetical protein